MPKGSYNFPINNNRPKIRESLKKKNRINYGAEGTAHEPFD